MPASFLLMFVGCFSVFFFCLSPFFEIATYLPIRTFLVGIIYATALFI